MYDSGSHIYVSEDSSGLRVYNSMFSNGNSLNNNHRSSGLYILGSNYLIFNSTFLNNHALYGGAIYCGARGTIQSSGFYNNSALNGSAIYIVKPDVILKDSFFASPKYDENNNLIEGYVYSSQKVNLINNTLSFTDLNRVVSSGNSNLSLQYNYKYFEDYDSAFVGGVVVGKVLSIEGNDYLIDCSNGARAFYISANNVVVNNLTFVEGIAKTSPSSSYANGGAISVSGNDVTISYCSFDSCSADHAGAVEICGSNGHVLYCNFINNHATSWDGALCFFNADSGGGVVEYCNFINNTARRWAAGIRVDMSISISNCNFTGNYVIKSTYPCLGAAIYIASRASTSYVTSCYFSNNTSENGAAIYNVGADVVCNDSIFVDNRVSINGGAIYSKGGNFILNACIFMNNSAVNGSAIYSLSSLVINGSSFACPKFNENNNILPGYIYSTNNVEFNNVALSFTDLSYLINNTDSPIDLEFDYLYFNDYDQEFINGVPITKETVINGNDKVINGNYSARIFNITSNTVLINLNLINGNASLGGAIYSIADLTLTNVTFANNTAVNGSAVYVIKTINNWDNITFKDNDASNATVYFDGDSTLYSNNLSFINNQVSKLNIVGTDHIYSPIIYVNNSRIGFGIITDEATSLTRAVDNILPNGKIFILDDYDVESIVKFTNLNNITVVGNKTKLKDKYLFILPIIQKYIKKKQIVF